MPQNRTLNELAHQRRRSREMYPPVICEECGVLFRPYNSKGCRCCSLKCKNENRNRLRRLARADQHERTCPNCGKMFRTKTPQKKFCRMGCVRAYSFRDVPENRERLEKRRKAQKAYSRTQAFRNSQRNAKARRRSAERAGEVITYEQWTSLIAKYKGRCVYCGEKPDKLTMDHVKPLAKGGKHKISNIVPACLSCNAAKGARDWSDRRCL